MSENQNISGHALDADLLTRVGIALTLRLRHTLHAVHIQVDKGTVILRGIVPTYYDRQLAIEVTRRVAGVLKVRDELTVTEQKTGSKEHVVYSVQQQKPASVKSGAGTESTKRSSASSVVRQLRQARSWKSLFGSAATVLRSLFLLIALVFVVGCGGGEPVREKLEVFPAKGSITFQGKPIPGAMITLHPVTPVENVPNPKANVAKDGTFSVKTYGGEEGAPEGDYKLTVLWYKPIQNGPDFTSGPNVIPQRYTKPETTNIQVKIAAGQNDLKTIQL